MPLLNREKQMIAFCHLFWPMILCYNRSDSRQCSIRDLCQHIYPSQCLAIFFFFLPVAKIIQLWNGTTSARQLLTRATLQLAPIYLVACELDPLLDDSVMFAHRLAALDIKFHFKILESMPHGEQVFFFPKVYACFVFQTEDLPRHHWQRQIEYPPLRQGSCPCPTTAAMHELPLTFF